MCLVGKGEIVVFAQNRSYGRFGATPNWTPFGLLGKEIWLKFWDPSQLTISYKVLLLR